jgi:hypothetical protein
MTFRQIVNAYLSGAITGVSSGGANLKISDDRLIHFSTTIAERNNDKYFLNMTKYSVETSRLQRILKDTIPKDIVVEVNGIPMGYKGSIIGEIIA